MSSPSDIKSGKEPASSQAAFSSEDRGTLLNIAHEAILSCFTTRTLPQTPSSPHLSEHRGVFTTLYFHGNLRGCVGYAVPHGPLYLAVAETARAAAFDDSRFQAVTQTEASELEISLSVLSPLFQIRAEEVQIGRHGLVVSMGSHRGLLLPQVPVEHNWDHETFLTQTCHKAGLPANSWRSGAVLEAFTAEVFGDEKPDRLA